MLSIITKKLPSFSTYHSSSVGYWSFSAISPHLRSRLRKARESATTEDSWLAMSKTWCHWTPLDMKNRCLLYWLSWRVFGEISLLLLLLCFATTITMLLFSFFGFLCFTMVLNDIWLQRPAKRGQQSKLVTAFLVQGPAGVEMLIPSALKVRSYEIHLQAESGRIST